MIFCAAKIVKTDSREKALDVPVGLHYYPNVTNVHKICMTEKNKILYVSG